MKKTLSILLAAMLCMTLFAGLAYAEEEAQGEPVIEYDLDFIASNITEAHAGITEYGEYIAFGVNQEGSYAIMIIFSEAEHMTFVGTPVIDGQNVSIADDVNGMTIGFDLVEASEEGVLLDFGESGQAALVPITVEQMMEVFVQVLNNTFTIESVMPQEQAAE